MKDKVHHASADASIDPLTVTECPPTNGQGSGFLHRKPEFIFLHGPDDRGEGRVYLDRHRTVWGDEEITVVFDKGNPSKANFTGFAQGPDGKGPSFVSSLSLSHHPDLGAVPLQVFSEVDPTKWPGLLAFRTEKTVYGAKRRVVVTYNPALAEGQRTGIRRQQEKIEAGLNVLAERLGSQPEGAKSHYPPLGPVHRFLGGWL